MKNVLKFQNKDIELIDMVNNVLKQLNEDLNKEFYTNCLENKL